MECPAALGQACQGVHAEPRDAVLALWPDVPQCWRSGSGKMQPSYLLMVDGLTWGQHSIDKHFSSIAATGSTWHGLPSHQVSLFRITSRYRWLNADQGAEWRRRASNL